MNRPAGGVRHQLLRPEGRVARLARGGLALGQIATGYSESQLGRFPVTVTTRRCHRRAGEACLNFIRTSSSPAMLQRWSRPGGARDARGVSRRRMAAIRWRGGGRSSWRHPHPGEPAPSRSGRAGRRRCRAPGQRADQAAWRACRRAGVRSERCGAAGSSASSARTGRARRPRSRRCSGWSRRRRGAWRSSATTRVGAIVETPTSFPDRSGLDNRQACVARRAGTRHAFGRNRHDGASSDR